MKNKKGFTLIELLVVVAIMGLLAALAIVALNQARARARDARRISDIKQIQTALELYYMDLYGYPGTPTANAIEDKCLDGAGFSASCGAEPTYMGEIPANPQPRNDGTCDDATYTYTVDTSGGVNYSYHILWCLGRATGDIAAGKHYATPAGISDGTVP
ncbi:prepilin-type N-terminal cleavage/methylation domain-containing protein [Patescibacteria group bacterium]|nr:prepilin-type N-terminal cleavage/methylation domain-containing protein [Patescibacteria group bacterium]